MDANYLPFSSLEWVEKQHSLYLENPEHLEPTWRAFFDGYAFASSISKEEEENPYALKAYLLIENFRCFGHLMAKLDPLNKESLECPAVLDPKTYGLSDPTQMIPSFGLFSETLVSLKALLEKLESIYCSSIGYEYKGTPHKDRENWIQEQIEMRGQSLLSVEERERVYAFLAKAEAFETFLHTRYVGQKRFSLEGCESLIPVMDEILEVSSKWDGREIVLGMAHRGRLNVLANILNKNYSLVFSEFEDNYLPDESISGDVKYHKGHEGIFTTKNGKTLEVTLATNPSHLESVGAVVAGMTKAKQNSLLNGPKGILPLIIHGDASVAGQGIVYECLQLSNIEGFKTEGTLHIILNNQIGFTALPSESRSTKYCSDIAKAFEAPVFHVNAEDVDACIAAAKLATEIRFQFGCDVFIDLIGYRKWGHNEGDEPTFTQPKRYKEIKTRPTILEIYQKKLIQEGYSEEVLEAIYTRFLESLKEHHEKKEIQETKQKKPLAPKVKLDTNLSHLQDLVVAITTLPSESHPHDKVKKLYHERLLASKNPDKAVIDWGFAELLAFAVLLDAGISVRLSGQDSQRGTFAQRHAVVVDQEDEHRSFPLTKACKDKASFQIYNTILSEFACLGFEYGYSLASLDTLVLWEAQYGDFANGAQIFIDQYLSSSEQKWGLSSSLTLLLPHGYEGQGPEHSSARLERFLQLCAQNNLTIAVPTTPYQYFHLLLEQAQASCPLIIFTPKATLRHPLCRSSLEEMSQGSFKAILPEEKKDKTVVNRLLFCYGKMYYELMGKMPKEQQDTTALIRLERLYPLQPKHIEEVLALYPHYQTALLVQEEPENMGAQRYLLPLFKKVIPSNKTFSTLSRKESASTAAGSLALHKKELEELLTQVFKP